MSEKQDTKKEVNKSNLSIGKFLKEQREKAGLTQQQVSEALKLRPSIIDAIEKEQWDKLPHITFAKGFIRSYAKLLKVDLSDISDAYNSISFVKADIASPLEEEGKSPRKKRILWIFLLAATVAIAIGVIWYKNFSKKRAIVNKSRSTVLRPLNKMIVPVSLKRQIRFPLLLKLKTKKRVWLSIAIDKYAPERYVLEPGECIYWQVKESIELVIGDASGVELWLNNAPVNFQKKEGGILYIHLKKKIKGVNRI